MTYLRFVRDLVPAEPPDVCEVASFPIAVVPFALAALESRIPRHVWAPEAYYRGVQLVRSLQMALLCGGLKEITDRQDQLYRMLDTAIYGREYVVVSTDPDLVIEPPIQETRLLAIESDNSMLGYMETIKQMLNNGINGATTPQYDRANGIRDLLEQLIAQVDATDDLDPELLAKLAEIALLVA